MPKKTALRKRRELAVCIAACSLIAYGGWGFWKEYQATHTADPVAVLAAVATDPAAVPDETPIDTKAAYVVPADIPRSISLPSLGVEGLIQRVSADTTGTIAVPVNVHVAGWYVASSKPGEEGLSIIDGHLQGKYREGIFKRLNEVHIGDPIQVSFGDGSTKKFVAVSAKSYSYADAGAALFAKDPDISRQLTLITCGGDYDTESKTYNQRIIVVARLAS